MTITRWTEEEDNILQYLVRQHGVKAWSLIAAQLGEMIGTLRTGKQCRLRWLHTLSPAVSNEPWTAIEEDVLFHQQSVLGNRWAQIARALPGRTDSSCKNRWYSSLRHGVRRIVKANCSELSGHAPFEMIASSTSNNDDRVFSTIHRIASEGSQTRFAPGQHELGGGGGGVQATGAGAGSGASASGMNPSLIYDGAAGAAYTDATDSLLLSKLPLSLRRALGTTPTTSGGQPGPSVARARKRATEPLAFSNLSTIAQTYDSFQAEEFSAGRAYAAGAGGAAQQGDGKNTKEVAAVAKRAKRGSMSIITKDLDVIHGLLSLTPSTGELHSPKIGGGSRTTSGPLLSIPLQMVAQSSLNYSIGGPLSSTSQIRRFFP